TDFRYVLLDLVERGPDQHGVMDRRADFNSGLCRQGVHEPEDLAATGLHREIQKGSILSVGSYMDMPSEAGHHLMAQSGVIDLVFDPFPKNPIGPAVRVEQILRRFRRDF